MLDYAKQKNEQSEKTNPEMKPKFLAPYQGLAFCMTALLLSFAIVSCTGKESERRTELIVFAASSLTNAFEELGEQFEKANPTIDVIFNFGSSSQLTAQIIEGVQGDLFASANETQMEILLRDGQVIAPVMIFCTNSLVIGVQKGNPSNITQLSDLTNKGLRVVLAEPQTPIREYSDLIIAGSLLPGDQTLLSDNIVSEEANVRQVVTKIALGEADAGIIYATDITPDIKSLVSAIPIPPQNNVTAQYPVAILSGSSSIEIAEEFIQFILGEKGQGILQKWGFGLKP